MEELNIQETMTIINYGVQVQNKLLELSNCAFAIVRGIDLDDTAELLSEILSYFKANTKMTATERAEAEHDINVMSAQLSEQRIKLLKECELLEQLCNVNKTYSDELGELIAHAQDVEEEMKERKLTSDERMRLSTLNKRIKELETTQTVAFSFAPQINIVKENEAQMAEKIQSALINVMALWKRQNAIEYNADSAEEASRKIMENINALLELQRKNAGYVSDMS